MENGQNEDLLEGLASQTPVANTEDSAMDLEVSDSLGKLANRSNAFKQRLEDFDAIKIGLASPEMIRAWSYGEVKSLKPSITVHSNQNVTVCSVLRFSDLSKIMSVCAVSTSA